MLKFNVRLEYEQFNEKYSVTHIIIIIPVGRCALNAGQYYNLI